MKPCLSFLRRKKSQAQARDAIKDKIHVSREKDRREDSKIPDASDKAKKRKGKGIGLTRTKVDRIHGGPVARDYPIEGGT